MLQSVSAALVAAGTTLLPYANAWAQMLEWGDSSRRRPAFAPPVFVASYASTRATPARALRQHAQLRLRGPFEAEAQARLGGRRHRVPELLEDAHQLAYLVGIG